MNLTSRIERIEKKFCINDFDLFSNKHLQVLTVRENEDIEAKKEAFKKANILKTAQSLNISYDEAERKYNRNCKSGQSLTVIVGVI